MSRLFQADPHLRLADTDICLDPTEVCKTAIVTHGHADHIARHDHFIATPATASFLRSRLGSKLRGTELRFGESIELEGYEIELIPAGHILGSAMVKVTREGRSLLYTGDFRLRPSWTAEPAVVPRVDEVIMESTYGSPEWRFPSRDEIGEKLAELVKDIHRKGRTPVVLAYSLGKAQEAMWWATSRGFSVIVHDVVARISELYVRHGVELGAWTVLGSQGGLFSGRASDDGWENAVVVVPPHLHRDVRHVPRTETISLTGWALKGDWRIRADHGVPLYDHADFDELVEFADRSRAEVVYVTHGSKHFARELRERGFNAEFVRRRSQMRLF